MNKTPLKLIGQLWQFNFFFEKITIRFPKLYKSTGNIHIPYIKWFSLDEKSLHVCIAKLAGKQNPDNSLVGARN